MTVKENFDNFVEKARRLHSNKFDYSLCDYTTQKSHVNIICPHHGTFSQTPDKHLNSKYGCPECWRENIGKYKRKPLKKVSKYNKEYTIHKLTEKFGDKLTFNMDDFDNTYYGKVNCVCGKHGYSFTKTAQQLLSKRNKHGCNKCSAESIMSHKTKSYDNFVQLAIKKHNNTYSYPESNRDNYKDRKSIINIYCDKHGLFKKRAQKHLSGQGCIRCMYDNLIENGLLPGGYCEETFKTNPELSNKNGTIYYLKINNGKFYKIGITINMQNRISVIKSRSNGYVKNIEVIQSYNDTLLNCFLAEQKILDLFSYARSPRGWSTEIFNEDILFGMSLVDFIE